MSASPRSTVQFVGISAFHTQIADPLIGGTYMTVRLKLPSAERHKLTVIPQLLNTVSNLGGTWPKFFVLKGIDAFSVAVCHVKDEGLDVIVSSKSGTRNSISCPLTLDLAGRECVSDHGKAACAELGGTCLTERDGYYWVSTLCILAGVAILVSFVQPVARRLQGAFDGPCSEAISGQLADALPSPSAPACGMAGEEDGPIEVAESRSIAFTLSPQRSRGEAGQSREA